MEEIDLVRVICRLHDLGDPGAKAFTIGQGEWPLRGFVVRRGDAVRGWVNHCPHAGYPLDSRPDGFLAEHAPLIQCSAHGALFDIESGLCVSGPCAGLSLRPIDVRVSQGCVVLADHVPLEEPPDLGR